MSLNSRLWNSVAGFSIIAILACAGILGGYFFTPIGTEPRLIAEPYEGGMRGGITASQRNGRTPELSRSTDRMVKRPPPVAPGSQTGTGEGVVLRVDREVRLVVIRQSTLVGIKDSEGKDMPAMTNGFKVSDPHFFDHFREGETTRFTVIADGKGFTIQSIEMDDQH